MVFQTLALMVRTKGPDEFWRKRRIFKYSAHFIGRKRNCYSIAVRYVQRALRYATQGRKLKKGDITELRDARIEAGCHEHGLSYPAFKEGLARSNILLNRKSLSDLAIWEPFSFKALVQIAWNRCHLDGVKELKDVEDSPPNNVYTGGSK